MSDPHETCWKVINDAMRERDEARAERDRALALAADLRDRVARVERERDIAFTLGSVFEKLHDTLRDAFLTPKGWAPYHEVRKRIDRVVKMLDEYDAKPAEAP